MRFNAAVENMSQGLCMFDRDARLVVCNELYARMYRLPDELRRPGALHRDIIAHRVRNGILKGGQGKRRGAAASSPPCRRCRRKQGRAGSTSTRTERSSA